MNRLLVIAPAVVLVAGVVAAEPAGTAKSAPPTPFEFGTGVTPQIKAMSWIEGTWDVSMTYQLPGGRSFKKDAESKIEPMLGGSFYREQITVPAGPTLDNHMIGIRSYDRFRNAYRLVWYDDVITLADVFEGPATEGGFTVSNVKTNTAGMFAGQQSLLRITQKAGASRDEFLVIWEVSPDKGKTWSTSAEYAYKRRKKAP